MDVVGPAPPVTRNHANATISGRTFACGIAGEHSDTGSPTEETGKQDHQTSDACQGDSAESVIPFVYRYFLLNFCTKVPKAPSVSPPLLGLDL